jgi:hypothetical protein
MPWSTPFPKPIKLQDVELATLDDARKLIKLLPKEQRERDAWTNAMDVLNHAAVGKETPGGAMAAVWLAIQLSPSVKYAT